MKKLLVTIAAAVSLVWIAVPAASADVYRTHPDPWANSNDVYASTVHPDPMASSNSLRPHASAGWTSVGAHAIRLADVYERG
jgi:hypothetical protein